MLLYALATPAQAQQASYSPPWGNYGGNYAAKVFPEYTNKADARAFASGSSVSVWAHSEAWIGGSGAIAIATQGGRYVASASGNYRIRFQYSVDGEAQVVGVSPGAIVTIAAGAILTSLEQAITNLIVKESLSKVIVGMVRVKNAGVHAKLVFAFGDFVRTYDIHSDEGWQGNIFSWQTTSIGAAIGDDPVVYLERGKTYEFSAILTVWTATAAMAVQTVGCLIKLNGPGLVEVSIRSS